MQGLGKTLVATLILALAGSACVDAGQSFKDYDKRVIDAATNVVVGSCNGGEIPDVSGEFYLALAPSIAPDSLIKLIVTTEIDRGATPPLLTLNFQPLCTQSGQCTVNEPVGDAFTPPSVEVTDECGFEMTLTDVIIPGGANPISGSEIIGNLVLLGSLRSTDLYCGIVNGTATVGGAPIPIDGSSFGSIRVAEGTLGDALPEPVAECPADTGDADAGVPDAGTPDAAP